MQHQFLVTVKLVRCGQIRSNQICGKITESKVQDFFLVLKKRLNHNQKTEKCAKREMTTSVLFRNRFLEQLNGHFVTAFAISTPLYKAFTEKRQGRSRMV